VNVPDPSRFFTDLEGAHGSSGILTVKRGRTEPWENASLAKPSARGLPYMCPLSIVT
jgi:hypothetical protein